MAELLARTPVDEDVERLLTEIEALSPQEVDDALNHRNRDSCP